MSWHAVEWAIDQPVDGNDHRVLIVVASYVGMDEDQAYPGQETIAKRLRLHRDTVGRCLRRLEEAGLIEREPRHRREGRGRTSDRIYLVGYDPDSDQHDAVTSDWSDVQHDGTASDWSADQHDDSADQHDDRDDQSDDSDDQHDAALRGHRTGSREPVGLEPEERTASISDLKLARFRASDSSASPEIARTLERELNPHRYPDGEHVGVEREGNAA